MDKAKGGKGDSKGKRISEMAAVVVIVAGLVLVGAELVVNVLSEMEPNGAKNQNASFVIVNGQR